MIIKNPKVKRLGSFGDTETTIAREIKKYGIIQTANQNRNNLFLNIKLELAI